MEHPLDQSNIKRTLIGFVLVLVREDSKLEANIGTACSLAERHRMEFDLFGSLITLTCGQPGDEASQGRHTQRLVSELSRCLGGAAKILHGSDIGHAGRLVGVKELRFSITLPHFTQARRQVETLEWGQIVEFRKENDG